jgi:hypothetical protein
MPKREKTQKTQPKGKDKRTGKPVKPMEIPVPKRRDVLRDLDKLAQPEKRAALRRTSSSK